VAWEATPAHYALHLTPEKEGTSWRTINPSLRSWPTNL